MRHHRPVDGQIQRFLTNLAGACNGASSEQGTAGPGDEG